MLYNGSQRAACRKVAAVGFENSPKLPGPQNGTRRKFSQDFRELERVLTGRNTWRSHKTSLSCKQCKMQKNWQWVSGRVNGRKPRAMAVAASPSSKEQTVPHRRRKTSGFPRTDLTTLTVKLISKSRVWSEETVSRHLVQNQNMENGISQIIKDTKGRIILKKDQVARRRRGNHIIRTSGICLTAQKQVLWQ